MYILRYCEQEDQVDIVDQPTYIHGRHEGQVDLVDQPTYIHGWHEGQVDKDRRVLQPPGQPEGQDGGQAGQPVHTVHTSVYSLSPEDPVRCSFYTQTHRLRRGRLIIPINPTLSIKGHY
jgi:hypothetical protein